MLDDDKRLRDENQQQGQAGTEKERKQGETMMASTALIMVLGIWFINDLVPSASLKLLTGIPFFVVCLVVIFFGYRKMKGK